MYSLSCNIIIMPNNTLSNYRRIYTLCFSSLSSVISILLSILWLLMISSPTLSQSFRSEIPCSRDSTCESTVLRVLSRSGISRRTLTSLSFCCLSAPSIVFITSCVLSLTRDCAIFDVRLNSASICSSSLFKAWKFKKMSWLLPLYQNILETFSIFYISTCDFQVIDDRHLPLNCDLFPCDKLNILLFTNAYVIKS